MLGPGYPARPERDPGAVPPGPGAEARTWAMLGDLRAACAAADRAYVARTHRAPAQSWTRTLGAIRRLRDTDGGGFAP
jgi:hypothetical protein